VLVDVAPRLREVEVRERRVVRAAGRDQDVVDRVASPMPALPPITTTVCPRSSCSMTILSSLPAPA
jgi:hypothetical protein